MVEDAALLELLGRLAALDYDFVPPTPATHERVIENRRGRPARTLRDILGWSLPFSTEILGGDMLDLLDRARALDVDGRRCRARYRVSKICGKLFLHSAFPTQNEDAVFLGPDSYRFVDFVLGELDEAPRRLCDLGAGSGVGGITVGSRFPTTEVTLVDSNPEALRLARINAAAANVALETVAADADAAPRGGFDLVIANPPYLVDESRRTYRHGGGRLGAEISLNWALEGARHLPPRGRFMLYTGSAIVAGRDGLRDALEAAVGRMGCTLKYREIDPDVFGEELERDVYREVERIAAIGAVIERTG